MIEVAAVSSRSAGPSDAGAARSPARSEAMTSAAPMPLPITSATVRSSWPFGRSCQSNRSPATSSAGRHAPATW